MPALLLLLALGLLMARRASFASLPIPAAAYAAVVASRRARGLPAPGSPFGLRVDPLNPDGPRRLHAGVDVACSVGTPLLAVADGIVTEARRSESAGNLVRYQIAAPPGVVSCMHLDAYSVRVGDVVRAGEVIGTTGATGNITGPHLHFEFRPTGASGAVDPLPFFPGVP